MLRSLARRFSSMHVDGKKYLGQGGRVSCYSGAHADRRTHASRLRCDCVALSLWKVTTLIRSHRRFALAALPAGPLQDPEAQSV